MSEDGWFAVDRGIFDHPLFARRDAFSPLEAWLYLIAKAAYRDRRQYVVGRMVELRRGQLVGTSRWLAGNWRWTEGRSRRFLLRLQALEMIRSKTDSGVTILTVCNYEQYQSSATETGARPAHDRRKKEQVNNGGDGGGDAPRGKSLISEEAFAIATEIIEAMGLHPHDPLSVGAPMAVQAWLNSGFHRDHIIFGVRRTMAKRPNDPPSSLRYFDKAIARAMAELTTPVQQGVADAQSATQPSLRLYSAIDGGRQQQRPSGGFAELRARLRRGGALD